MPSIEKQVEEFARQLIDFHGFRFNEGFSCLIPDTKEFPVSEGLFLWGFSQKRMRFETKVEKLHTATRLKRMEQMLNLSEKEYKKLFPSIVSYLKSLKELGFTNIGKGVKLFGKAKIYNVQADIQLFENNLEALKAVEQFTLNNPLLKFAEDQGYFEVKNRDKLLWDSYFGSVASTSTKVVEKTEKKLEKKSEKKVEGKPDKTGSPRRLLSSMPFGDKLKKLATTQPESTLDGEQRKNTWTKQVNALYKKVQTWLSEHVKNGYITFNTSTIKLSEENLGHYDIDSLELDLVGGHQVIFEPVEMNILGAMGRIDVYHRGYNPHKVMLLLHDMDKSKAQWELWKGLKKAEQQSFNKATLEALLNQWIEF